MIFQLHPFELEFKVPAKTSRNTLNHKKGYVLKVVSGEKTGYGEISPFPGLSIDDRDNFHTYLTELTDLLNGGLNPSEPDLKAWPSIRFGLESALLQLKHDSPFTWFDGLFSRGECGIPINGLIWMASREDMLKQVEQKVAQGFTCIKLKIGALDFDEECRMLESIRERYSAFRLELRVDANGTFHPDDAAAALRDLSRFELHSIEQPIRQGNPDAMARLCRETPLPVALDEELLGIDPWAEGASLLQVIRPQYVILKPGLLGGFRVSDAWIDLAARQEAGWWITSALESNLGLAAIAQYTASKKNPLPQGLGTGQLYTNNFPSPLNIRNGNLYSDGRDSWQLPV